MGGQLSSRVALTCGCGFVLYTAASASWLGLALLASLVLACLVGYCIDDAWPLWAAYTMFAFAAFAVFMIHPYDVYANGNYIGCILAMALAGCLACRFYICVPVLGLMLLITQSRGAIFAGATALFMSLWRRFPTMAFTLVAMAVVFALAQPKDAGSLWARMGIWQDTLNHLTLWGSGFGSFADAYAAFTFRTNMTGVLAPHAYNDVLELIFELGIGAIFLWVAIIAVWEDSLPADRLICLTFFVLGLTFFPLWIPLVGHAFAFTLGRMAWNKRSVQWPAGALSTRTT